MWNAAEIKRLPSRFEKKRQSLNLENSFVAVVGARSFDCATDAVISPGATAAFAELWRNVS